MDVRDFPLSEKLSWTSSFEWMSHGVNFYCLAATTAIAGVTVRTNFNAMRLHIKRRHINNFYRYDECARHHLFIFFFFSFCNLSTIDNVLDLSQRHHVRMLSLYVFVCLFVLNMNARVVFFSSFLFLACLSGASLISICVKYYFFSLRY